VSGLTKSPTNKARNRGQKPGPNSKTLFERSHARTRILPRWHLDKFNVLTLRSAENKYK